MNASQTPNSVVDCKTLGPVAKGAALHGRASTNDEMDRAGGHRARLRKRLLDAGPEGFHDYELVEYLLALTIPRVDTKPLAKRLLHDFGGVGPLLSASADTLRNEGLTDPTIAALKIAQATALIIVHNHPSGDPTPSAQDIRLTRDLVEAGRHMKITVHDHVVVGAQGRTSLRAMGLI